MHLFWKIEVEFRNPVHGYLGILDWPLMAFFGGLFGLYVLVAFVWIYLDTRKPRVKKFKLNSRFCLSVILLLSVFEMACFFIEFYYTNTVGQQSGIGLLTTAEVFSATKRSIAR